MNTETQPEEELQERRAHETLERFTPSTRFKVLRLLTGGDAEPSTGEMFAMLDTVKSLRALK